MKKNRLLTLLSSIVALSSIALVGCESKNDDQVKALYEKAKENGETATFEEWLASLKGEKGDKGDAGKAGNDGKDGVDGKDGIDGKDGSNGIGIASITKTATNGNVDTYTITLTDGSTSTFEITNGKDGQNGADGKNGTNGTNGENGTKGETGVGIASVTKTATNGNVDTYTITLTDGSTSTFEITNGKDGTNGNNGTNGENGVGIVSIEKSGSEDLVDTYTITMSDGTTSTFTVTNGKDGKTEESATGNGIASIEKTGSLELVDTYTITFTDGTTTNFEITNGEKGEKGDPGIQGAAGNGVKSVTKTSSNFNVDTYTIELDDGTLTTFDVTNGIDGKSVNIVELTNSNGLVDTYTIQYSDGTTSSFTVTNGEKGDKGDTGHTVDFNHTVIEEKDGKYYLRYQCLDCGEGVGSVIDSAEIPNYSTASFEVNLNDTSSLAYTYNDSHFKSESNVYPFTIDDEGYYMSGAPFLDSGVRSVMSITATSNGVIAINGLVGGEVNYDYAVIEKNDEVLYNYKTNYSMSDNVSFDYSIEVNEGDVISIGYRHDSSVFRGISGIKFKIAPTKTSPHTATFVTNNGQYIAPQLIVGGKIDYLPTLTKKDFYFDGWYDSEAYKNKVTVDTVLEDEDYVLYPKYYSVDEAYDLWGKHSGVYFNGTNTSTSLSIDETYLDVDFFGNFKAKVNTQSSAVSGKFTTFDKESGIATSEDGYQAYYDAEAGIVFMYMAKNPTASTNLGMYVFNDSSNQTAMSSNISSTTMDSGKYRFISYTKDKVTYTYFIDVLNKTITKNVKIYDVESSEITDYSTLSSNFIFTIKNATDDEIGTFGYSGYNSLSKLDSTLSKVYYNIGETLTLAATSNTTGYVLYSEHSNSQEKMSVTISENTLTAKSTGSYNYTFVINTEDDTFTPTINRSTITYDWGDVTPSEAKSNDTYWNESWYYTSNLPKVSYKNVNGLYYDETNYYQLDGWYTDATFSSKLTSSFKIAEDKTLYAKWTTLTTVTVTLHAAGADDAELDQKTFTVPSGYAILEFLSEDPTKTGTKFDGWYYEDTYATKFALSDKFTTDSDLYAKFVATPNYASMATCETIEDATVTATTTTLFPDYYTKFVISDAGKYIINASEVSDFVGANGNTSKYYARFTVLDNEGSVILSATSFDSTKVIALDAGTYYIHANLGGNVEGNASTKGGAGTFTFTYLTASDADPDSCPSYTLGEEVTFTKYEVGNISKLYKVHLEEGVNYQVNISSSAYARIDIYGTVVYNASSYSFKTSNNVKYLTVYSSPYTNSSIFTVSETGDYYISSSYNMTFSISLAAN